MRTFNITVNGQTYQVEVEEVGGVQTAAPVRAAAPVAAAPVAAAPAAAAPKAAPAAAPVAGGTKVTSPMPGNVLDIKVKAGDKVKTGDALVMLEAMKMENPIPAPKDGTVLQVVATKGSAVEAGAVLVVMD